MAMDRLLLLPVLIASVSLMTSAVTAYYGNDTCESNPVDCDCKYINHNLEQFCQDPENWGEMSGCHVDLTGLNYSISWCPLFIRNKSCVSNMKIRLNFFDVINPKRFDTGTADLVAYIPGFLKPIFSKKFEDQHCEKLIEELPETLKELRQFLKCPLSFKEIPPFVLDFLKQKEGYKVPNPLPTIVPAGSYHLMSNVTTNNDMFLCVDGWLEFGV